MSKLIRASRRHRKSYTSEDQIIAEIDRKSRLAVKKAKLSEQLFSEQKQLFRKSGDLLTEYEQTPEDETEVRQLLWEEHKRVQGNAKAVKERGETLGRQHSRLIEQVIPRLKQILSAFRTETMPAVLGSYRGVALP